MSQSFGVGDRARLDVRIPSGRIYVSEGTRGEISVEVSGRGSEAIEVVQAGDTVTVRRTEGGRMRSVVVRAEVPAGCRVDLALASADVDLSGGIGPLTLKTASGDLRAEQVASLEATTASGDVSVDRVDGDVAVMTASGDVDLGSVAGRLDVKLASGDVRVGSAGGSCRCSSASGDLVLNACLGDEVSVKTVSGDVRLGFPPGIRLEADCNSLSGRIRFPEPVGGTPGGATPGGESGERRHVRLSGRSVSGDIVIERIEG